MATPSLICSHYFTPKYFLTFLIQIMNADIYYTE